MPTKHPRHAITETPEVKEALDELRAELGTDRLPMGELVIAGARAKLAELRFDRGAQARREMAEWIRTGRFPFEMDVDAADEVKHKGLIAPR